MTKDFLTLAAAGAIITTAGSLIALFIKELFLVRYFEERKRRNSVDDIFRKYKDPITLSAIELTHRLIEVHRDFPSINFQATVLKSAPRHLERNSAEDPYFKKYKLISTVFRLCTFLGWLELYRQEVTFLQSSSSEVNLKLENCLFDIREDLSNGRFNNHPNWYDWMDGLIFREEQRAVGESMIFYTDKIKGIIGYAKFKAMVEEFATNGTDTWLVPTFNFFMDQKEDKDFRRQRYLRLLVHFGALLKSLDGERTGKVTAQLDKYLNSLGDEAKNLLKSDPYF